MDKPIDGVVQALIEVAVGKVQHLYRGTCPDAIEGFDSRDPQCPACRVLTAAQQKGLRIVEPIRNCATPESREAAMVVLETDAEGNPTIWCDPEIADLVRALNVGGVRTKASCSGHGEKPFGIVSLQDGRELIVLPDWETTRRAERILDAGLSAQQQGQAVAWADDWRAAVAAKLSSYGLSEEAAAVFAASELDEYRAGLCDCAENDPADMVDLMMGVARDAIEIWKTESAGRPFGHKDTAPPPSVPVGWKLVPVETDARMLDAAFMAFPRFASDTEIDQLWAAMLAAAPALAQQPAAVDEAYPTPRNRAEAVALARLALAHLGVIDAHIDAAIARCETDLATQQPAAVDRARFRKAPCYLCGYNGAGCFQSETHPCAALYHATQPGGSDNG